jgi:hypothetical protein
MMMAQGQPINRGTNSSSQAQGRTTSTTKQSHLSGSGLGDLTFDSYTVVSSFSVLTFLKKKVQLNYQCYLSALASKSK